MDLTWLLLLSALLLPLIFFLLPHANGSRRIGGKSISLPPGPRPFPMLGNILWLTISDYMEIMAALRRLHARYGPLLSVRMGSRLEVTIADRRLAHTALVERGAALADRPEDSDRDLLGLNAVTISSSNNGPFLQLFRRNFVTGIAHLSRLRQFAPARAAVVADLTDTLRRRQEEEAGTIMEALQQAVYRLLLAMCFGELLDARAVRDVADAQRDLLLYTTFKLNVFAYAPAVTKRLFRRRLQTLDAMVTRLKSLFLPLIEARRERKKLGAAAPPVNATTTMPHSYADTLLDIKLSDQGGRALNDDEMVAMCSEFLSAGTDTSAAALEWIMAELVKNPKIQEKLYADINAGGSRQGGQVFEEELQKMPYVRAVVLEGLRRHPPAHVLVPHAAVEDMELGGYVIPKGTKVNFMVREMGLDGRVWDRPMEFVPERFLAGGDGHGVDITGAKEIKMMPFGAGQRICPALPVATLHLEYFVANLVAAFEWRQVQGEEVDVAGEKAEFTVVMSKPLRATLVPRAAAMPH